VCALDIAPAEPTKRAEVCKDEFLQLPEPTRWWGRV